jgi:hypothetical protein
MLWLKLDFQSKLIGALQIDTTRVLSFHPAQASIALLPKLRSKMHARFPCIRNDSAGIGMRECGRTIACSRLIEKMLKNFSLRISPLQTRLDSFHAMNVFFRGTTAANFYL